MGVLAFTRAILVDCLLCISKYMSTSKGTLSNKNVTDLVCSALFSLLRYTIPLNTHWQPIGDKESHANDLSKITWVPEAVFRDGLTSN